MSRQDDYNRYRLAFKEFVYDSYKFDVQPDGLHIEFCFQVDNTHLFRPTATIPWRSFFKPEISHSDLETLVFNIGMIELVSYWKAFCPPTVVVRPFTLTEEQIAFWKKIYFNGLGEFFYTNGILATIGDFMQIRCESDRKAAKISPAAYSALNVPTIVPIGGGKDSVVTLETLQTNHREIIPLIMNPRGATEACVVNAGFSMEEVIVIKRTIHPLLLELNSQGALNGHTPFSAMLAFYTLLAAALTGRGCRIALSNESSANESTVAGTDINHQYSKSVEFENDFRSYVDNFVVEKLDGQRPLFDYYSFLRPLSELQIAMLFARQPKYFDVFRSCNVGSKQDIWCGHCAKCLFAYIILSPFIQPERLNAIFGKNMLDDETLRLEFRQLTGEADVKPFECVGTVSEVLSALSMTVSKWYPAELPSLLKDFVVRPVQTPLDTLETNNNLPDDDLSALRDRLSDTDDVESIFRYGSLFNLLAGKEILIAGYGREGKSSHRLLQRIFPGRSFDIANDDKEIAEALGKKSYDLVLKSPGIPSMRFDGLCNPDILTSQCDLFLRIYSDITVGVTGTKGKSTTATLISHVLGQLPDRNVILAGNMGIPLFDIIDKIDAHSIVVAELSCHQLERIQKAPHISVLLNLFQEHLDHYRNYNDYCMAKMQIALRQGRGDHLFYCIDNDDLAWKVTILDDAIVSQSHPYSVAGAQKSHFLDGVDNPLSGLHNLGNIYAVWGVSQLFGLSQEQFAKAVETFHGLEHRLEKVAEIDGVLYYNDSISTIPQTAIAAVNALGNVATMILGGFDRGIDYSPLADFLCQNPLGKAVETLVLWGTAGQSIEKELKKSGFDFEKHHLLSDFSTYYDMSKAVRFASENTPSGRACLLSPAASSYDHYKNFEERGRHFKDCVMSLRSCSSQDDRYSDILASLHSHPGVSGSESYAHDLIVRELSQLNATRVYDHVGGYGVIAYWQKAGKQAATIAFRADTDALPFGHRCGHDGHTTIMLRFASFVDSNELPYNILLVFQPEEETGMGARKIVESGILQQHSVKAVFGLHNLPGYSLGTVVLSPGTFAAASCGVIYKFHGRKTHASTPENGLNPALAIADLIKEFSNLNRYSRDVQQFRQSTLICCRIGEEAFGTSAGDGELMFTLRAFTNDAMDSLMQEANLLAAQAASRAGLELNIELREPFSATENTPLLVDKLKGIFTEAGLSDVVEISTPFRWSEDFAEYLKCFPGAFFGIGSGVDQPELHHPDYSFPSALVEPAAHCFELISSSHNLLS